MAKELEPVLQSWYDALSVRSIGTAKVYVLNLKYFLRDLELESAQSLLDKLRSGDLDPYVIMNRYISLLTKEGKTPNTISGNLNALRRFLRFNDVKIDRDKLKDKVITPKLYQVFEDRIPTTEELITLYNSATQRGRVIIVLGIHGLRIGEIGTLKLGDLVLDGEIPHVNIRSEVAKGKKGRIIPLTPQAVEALKAYLVTRKNDGDMLMGLTTDRLRKFVQRLLKKCKLDEHTDKGKDKSTMPRTIRRYKLHPHSLRKYFDTYLSVAGVEQSFKARLVGHKNYLDASYFMANKEQISREFTKVIPYITIGRSVKREDIQDSLEAQVADLRKTVERFTGIRPELLQEAYRKQIELELLEQQEHEREQQKEESESDEELTKAEIAKIPKIKVITAKPTKKGKT